jgi:hypothetical protein
MATQRASSSYYVAAAVLVASLATFVVLVALVLRSPQRVALFRADAPVASTCLPGSEADACFDLQVRNTGTGPGYLQCTVSPFVGTTALFHTSGLPNIDSTGGYQPSPIFTSSTAVRPDQTLDLLIEVKADKGKKPATPLGVCSTVPSH